MHRIIVNVQTGEISQVELTAEEIAQAEAQYAEWALGEEQRKQDKIALLEEQLAHLKGAA